MKQLLAMGLAACLLASCTTPPSSPTTASTAGSSTSGTTGSSPSTGKALKVGIVFDKGGLGDKSFNDSANAGLEKAEKDFGIEAMPVQSKEESDYETNIRALADKGADLVIAVGISMQTALEKVAADYPKVNFAVVDADVKAPNVRALLFKEEEGSFLVGYIAGLSTKTNKVGFVGGMELPLIHKFEFGYAAGAKTANPNVQILPAKYVGSWEDQLKAKVAATGLFNDGADVVYHAAGRAGLGVIGAAQDAKKFAIGVDSNQDDIAPGFVLTSMIKHVDEAVYSTISDLKSGKFTAGEKVYDLASKGVGVSDMKYTKDKFGPENMKKLDAVQADIISGKIKVPSTKDEFDAYQPAAK